MKRTTKKQPKAPVEAVEAEAKETRNVVVIKSGKSVEVRK